MKYATILALLLLVACQTAPVVVELTPGALGDRQTLEGYFSFISPVDYIAEFENVSVFISDSQEEIFISLAVIGAGEDERMVQGLLDDIFEKFDGVEITTPVQASVDGMPGQKAEFSGVIGGGVVSGYYLTIDLGDDISFLAFGMGKVTQDTDSWQQFGQTDFTQLLETVEILFGSTF